jgi:hypothetical protein
VGIGVGIAIVAIVVLAGGTLLLWRRQRSSQSPPDYKHVPPQKLGAVQEMKRAELHTQQPTAEMP